MKKISLALFISITAISAALLGVTIACIMISGCTTHAEKVENAQSNVVQANKNLDDANNEYLSDIDSYRKATAEKIAANDKTIAEFKVKAEASKIENSMKLAELEQKNKDLKKKMDDYKAEGKGKWEIFKADFNHDLDEMGKSFSDLTK